jgi:hypothetical protein
MGVLSGMQRDPSTTLYTMFTLTSKQNGQYGRALWYAEGSVKAALRCVRRRAAASTRPALKSPWSAQRKNLATTYAMRNERSTHHTINVNDFFSFMVTNEKAREQNSGRRSRNGTHVLMYWAHSSLLRPIIQGSSWIAMNVALYAELIICCVDCSV